jgi:hypothetical protein
MRALDWLAADLPELSKSLDSKNPKSRKTVQSTMKRWRRAADLAGIRDAEPLAKLSEAERNEWKSLWADVDQLLKKADQP